MRGFVGIGVYAPKTQKNIETLIRSAKCFDADFVFSIGTRFRTTNYSKKMERSIPVFLFKDLEQFQFSIPYNSNIVCVEITDKARKIETYIPQERTVYLLGPEDGDIPEDFMFGKQVIKIPTIHCLNVAVAGSIVLYNHVIKGNGNGKAITKALSEV